MSFESLVNHMFAAVGVKNKCLLLVYRYIRYSLDIHILFYYISFDIQCITCIEKDMRQPINFFSRIMESERQGKTCFCMGY